MRTIALLSLLACQQDIAVRDVLLPPSVRFEAPEDGETFAERDTVALIVLVTDDQDAPEVLGVRWVSDIDGPLQPTATTRDGVSDASTLLSPGRHRIEVTVTDSDGLTASAARTVAVTDDPDAPQVEIVRPLTGDDAIENLPYTISARVTDDRDAPEDLQVVVSSDLDGELCRPLVDALGELFCDVNLSAGRHRLSFEATDLQGNLGRAEAFLRALSHEDIDDDGDGWTESQGDCNDNNERVNPAAVEFCDGFDGDCDGLIDEGTSCGDDDGDGYTELDGDCDDTDPGIHPDAVDAWYDGIDSDCGGEDDFDQDGDGVPLIDDCDDQDRFVQPGAPEICNAIDDDCDGGVDEGTSCGDDDGDGVTEDQGDCDDADPSRFPGATEVWYDGIDSDCGEDDDFDQDGDGHPLDVDCDDTAPAVNPAAMESCNGFDDDCDGSTDEGLTNPYYLDADGDGYGKATAVLHACSRPEGYVTNSDDCYDSNANARPTATSWQSSHRGDGSYDFNCDGSSSKRYTANWSCFENADGDVQWSDGWSTSSDPNCGSSGTHATGCDWHLGIPDFWNVYIDGPESTSSRTQTCR